MKYLIGLSLISAALMSSASYAQCVFEVGSAKQHLTYTIPGQFSFPRDMPIGSTIFDSGWMYVNSTEVPCNIEGSVTGKYTGHILAAMNNVPGYTDGTVYSTPIPGVGMQLFWCNMESCNPNPSTVTPPAVLNWWHGKRTYTLRHNWWVRLVKVGDFQNTYSKPFNVSSSIYYSGLEVASITVQTPSNVINVSSRTCNVSTPNNFTVQLPTVNKAEFKNIGALNGKTSSFSLDMMCERDLKVNYMFTSLNQNSELGNVINNSTGNNMATGVGIQLFKGGAESTSVVNLNQKYLQTTTGTTNNNFVSIPFTAKYYKIKDSMTGGLVNTKAVFTLTYE